MGGNDRKERAHRIRKENDRACRGRIWEGVYGRRGSARIRGGLDAGSGNMFSGDGHSAGSGAEVSSPDGAKASRLRRSSSARAGPLLGIPSFSHRHTVERLTPAISANCVCVRFRAFLMAGMFKRASVMQRNVH